MTGIGMTEQSETVDKYSKEVERMAEARVEIENDLEARKEELSKIGEFDVARCTAFEKNGDVVKFVFQHPDGSKSHKRYTISTSPESLDGFVSDHGADSVTDMVGTTHPAIYTNDGWQLWRSATVNPRLYYSRVSEDGSLSVEPWAYMAVPWVIWAVLMSLAAYIGISFGYTKPVIFMTSAGMVFPPLASHFIRERFRYVTDN